MSGIIQKIKAAFNNRTTYRIGLLQAKAYRVLKQHTGKNLQHKNISTIQWAFLGLLNDFQDGVRANIAASELGVEAPFVTEMFRGLKEKKLVEAKPDPTDSRAKLLCLTEEGKKFVSLTEAELRSQMRFLVKGVSANDLTSYLTVLEKIVENYEQQK